MFNPSKLRLNSGNWLIIILFISLFLEIIYFFPEIKPEDELISLVRNGSAKEKILAIQILSNQGETWEMNEEVLHELLGSSSSVLREFAMTLTVTRFLGNRKQAAYLRDLTEGKEKIRGSFFLKFQLGTGIPMKLENLSDYLDNLDKDGISR